MSIAVGLTFVAAVVFASAVRGPAVAGIALLFLLFVPLEKAFPLRRQRVVRPGLVTDLTHLLVNNVVVTVAAIGLAVVTCLPLLWLRSYDVAAQLPLAVSIPLAVVLIFVGNYWAHRLTHRVPVLWRFHAVHHSIEQMDWVASGRLHPLDSAFTQAVTMAPLLLLGYGGGAFAGTAVVVALLALFQHANVRISVPVIRWIIQTPEWHHWHHATDLEAHDTNFGLPLVDKLFGTAYLPKDRLPAGFGIPDPVPGDHYLRQMAYPFTAAARPSQVTSG
jgi:sterol desaturase/sphingolipid hydroxylase (fatty acid hydroxylase superfamily)